jgi:di/tricarboxylate transporter
MTPDIILVLSILIAAVIFLVTEWIPMEVVALLVLGATAIFGLVTPTEALAGWSNPAVITVWAVFILSSGLTKTGVANIIGRLVLRVAGRSEASIITVIMISAGVMSAFMNNVAVAALMLPVIMDISRQTGQTSSRLMMPLAYGSLLGGLMTKIGTPPNLIVSEMLRAGGLKTFKLFDFTPIGIAVLLGGTAFMAFFGRHLLPKKNLAQEESRNSGRSVKEQYQLQERMFSLEVPVKSAVVGKSLAQIRLGSILGLNVIGITRKNKTILAPSPFEIVQASDCLTVQGAAHHMDRLRILQEIIQKLKIDSVDTVSDLIVSDTVKIAEIELTGDSPLRKRTLKQAGFHNQYRINVLAVKRKQEIYRIDIKELTLKAGDTLLVQGELNLIEHLEAEAGFQRLTVIAPEDLVDVYRINEFLMKIQLPQEGLPDNWSLEKSRLGAALGLRVLSIVREGQLNPLPKPSDVLLPGDILVLEGEQQSLKAVRNLSELRLVSDHPVDLDQLEAPNVGWVEAILHPHTQLAGKTLSDLHFREKYGLNVVSIWRQGKVLRSDFLGDLALQVGDAMLLYGPRNKFKLLAGESDFLVLTESAQEVPDFKKAKVALFIMFCAVMPAVLDIFPIYISTLVGAAFMVITGCLSMEEAHQSIEWKGIILIAGMLPLGTALDNSGAARFLANGVVQMAGPLGPTAVMAGLMALTFMATCVIPTAALVVLLVPIVLSTAASMGIQPHSLMMAVSISASASFMTPIAHPANIMVMGPGGYKFSDYFKVGGPLTLIVFVIVVILVPIFWPF